MVPKIIAFISSPNSILKIIIGLIKKSSSSLKTNYWIIRFKF